MSHDADYLYALEIQKRWNGEADGDSDIEEVDFKPPAPSKKPLQFVKRSNPHSNLDEEFLNRTHNLVHPQWETLDPTPDIFALFGAFDGKFFQGRLKCVTLEWSKRMYSCAGICYSRKNRFGMDVTIRLSEPLLKLRPRKDLVETMLHEMIHAYCFVLNIREGNGGHGPNFKKIMHGINKVAGTNITVYHTFHDEVDLYKQHWWRCNGSCQNRSPFFGYVKRTSNRAPGPNDQWWAAHLESCGGTFMKIKEPEKKKKEKPTKTKEKENKSAGTDLRKFFPTKSENTTSGPSKNVNSFGSGGLNKGGFKGPIKMNGGGTMVLNPKTKNPSLLSVSNISKTSSTASSIATAFPPTSYPGLSSDPFSTSSAGNINRKPSASIVPPGGNLRNVMGFRDFNSSSSGEGGGNSGRAISGPKVTTQHNMIGRGYSINSDNIINQTSAGDSPSTNGLVDRNHLRNLWSKRFGGGEGSGSGSASGYNGKSKSEDIPPAGDSKRRRISTDGVNSSQTKYIADEVKKEPNVKGDKNSWVILDDDVMFQDKVDEVIALSSDEDSDESDVTPVIHRKHIKLTQDERQTAIKREIMDESTGNVLTDDDIVLIDDDYNDDEDLLNTSAAIELADTSLIDDLFGEDTLLKEFKRENDVIPSGSGYLPNPQDDIITCPICQGKMKRCVFANHLDGCTGIAVKILAPKHALKKLASTAKQLKPKRNSGISRHSAKDVLRRAGYTEEDLANITSASSADEEEFLNNSGVSSPPTRSSVAKVNVDSSDESTRRHRQRNLFKTTRQCPVCAQEIEENEMNEHLDECLSK